jgi:hypothetical protein
MVAGRDDRGPLALYGGPERGGHRERDKWGEEGGKRNVGDRGGVWVAVLVGSVAFCRWCSVVWFGSGWLLDWDAGCDLWTGSITKSIAASYGSRILRRARFRLRDSGS